MVGVDDQPQGTLSFHRLGQRLGQAVRVGDGNAGVNADRVDVRHRGQGGDDAAQAPWRQHQGVAAGQDDLLDCGVVVEPRVGGLQFGVGQQAAVGADVFAAEAEAAIDRADQHRLEQGAVGIGHTRLAWMCLPSARTMPVP